MIELKHSEAWNSLESNLLPTTNLTAVEVKKLAQREADIDAIMAYMKQPEVHVKINTGIFKGTIFPVNTQLRGDDRWRVSVHLREVANDAKRSGWNLKLFAEGKDPSKNWQFAERALSFGSYSSQKPIIIGANRIETQFLGGEHGTASSILFGYEGDPVFCLDTKKRPQTFTDRLDQEVAIGDLVVVALNYGVGLDVCVVKGFSDERRVLIESMESGSLERIPLEKNATRKIMKMPNTLKDTALMMKLAR